MFDFYTSESHYAEHLLPVWFALDDEERGKFYAPGRIGELLALEGIHPEQSSPPLGTRPVVIAGWKDLARCTQRPVALADHGVGQTYEGVDNPSYAGGRDRERVSLFLCPSARVAKLNQARYPETPAIVVGCPKLDRWANSQMLGSPEVPTVAVAFHWNSNLLPETRWAFPAFKNQVIELAKDPRFRVIGHGHPRGFAYLRDFYEAHGIEAVADFDEVVGRASVYVCDNSSTIYEAAFADIPTVVLNPPWYRRDVHHGLRFWDTIPGLMCSPEDDLGDLVREALADGVDLKVRRQAVAHSVYTLNGGAAVAAAGALRLFLSRPEVVAPAKRGRSPYATAPRRVAPLLPERRFRRLGANGPVLNEARLRWVEMSPAERADEQQRLASLTDAQLSAALAETLVEVAVGG